MSWPWHGQGPPPPLLPPGQAVPPLFGVSSSCLPPPPPFTPFPPGQHAPPPPFFHPVAQNPVNAWPPAMHGVPWQQHRPVFQPHPEVRRGPPPPAIRRRRTGKHHGHPPARLGRPVVLSEARTVDPKGQKAKKDDVSARDLALSKQVLGKMGVQLPGESQAEIDQWVAERKRNWPSRANVARKMAERKKREENGAILEGRVRKRPRTEENSLSVLATEYGSSDGEVDEGENNDNVNVNDDAGSETKKIVEGKKKESGRGKKRQRGRRNGKKGNPTMVTASRRPNLLRLLLENEIQEERNVLLQAFRYILYKKRDSL